MTAHVTSSNNSSTAEALLKAVQESYSIVPALWRQLSASPRRAQIFWRIYDESIASGVQERQVKELLALRCARTLSSQYGQHAHLLVLCGLHMGLAEAEQSAVENADESLHALFALVDAIVSDGDPTPALERCKALGLHRHDILESIDIALCERGACVAAALLQVKEDMAAAAPMVRPARDFFFESMGKHLGRSVELTCRPPRKVDSLGEMEAAGSLLISAGAPGFPKALAFASSRASTMLDWLRLSFEYTGFGPGLAALRDEVISGIAANAKLRDAWFVLEPSTPKHLLSQSLARPLAEQIKEPADLSAFSKAEQTELILCAVANWTFVTWERLAAFQF